MKYNFVEVAIQRLKQTSPSPFKPFPSKDFPIDEYNRLALDRVKSISAVSAHSAVKGLSRPYALSICMRARLSL